MKCQVDPEVVKKIEEGYAKLQVGNKHELKILNSHQSEKNDKTGMKLVQTMMVS